MTVNNEIAVVLIEMVNKYADCVIKLAKIRKILEPPQYMDEAVLLKINIQEVLDS